MCHVSIIGVMSEGLVHLVHCSFSNMSRPPTDIMNYLKKACYGLAHFIPGRNGYNFCLGVSIFNHRQAKGFLSHDIYLSFYYMYIQCVWDHVLYQIFGSWFQHAIQNWTQSDLRFCRNEGSKRSKINEKGGQLDRTPRRKLIQNV